MIVDASVAIKWVVEEADSERAFELLDSDNLAAPDLIFCEVANAIWKKHRRGELSGIPSRLRIVTQMLTVVEPSSNLMSRASELAVELGHPAYDCFYLALAELRGDIVVTADARLISVCARTRFATLVTALDKR